MPPSDFKPSAPKGLRIYAIGDIHGRIDLLEKMLRKIDADHLGYRGNSVVVFLGDYVDRGPNSKEVLELLSQGSAGRLTFHCLRGNHDDIILRLFKDHSLAQGWFHYGGLQTLRSYGIPAAHATQDFDELFHMRKQLEDHMPNAHKRFLENLPYTARYGDYLFTHAGIHPGRPLEEQDPHHYMWMREPFLSCDDPLVVMVVHGHSIRLKPECRVNRIGIDTGAYVTGHLTCLVLEDETQRFLSTLAE